MDKILYSCNFHECIGDMACNGDHMYWPIAIAVVAADMMMMIENSFFFVFCKKLFDFLIK